MVKPQERLADGVVADDLGVGGVGVELLPEGYVILLAIEKTLIDVYRVVQKYRLITTGPLLESREECHVTVLCVP